MIQELRIRNFLSFKEEAIFSFEATPDTFAESSQVVKVDEHTRLLRFVAVYGYNASGKSNLLKAFTFLRTFWLNNPDNPTERIDVVPFKLDKETIGQDSSFELMFYVESRKYRYKLEVNPKAVTLEQLSLLEGEEEELLFTRILNDGGLAHIEFQGALTQLSEGLKEKITLNCLSNKSIFAAYSQINADVEHISSIASWMRVGFMDPINMNTKLTKYANEKFAEDSQLKSYLLGFLKSADFNITDIMTNKQDVALPPQLVEALISDDDIPLHIREKIKEDPTHQVTETLFSHSVTNARGVETYELNLNKGEESHGTMRIFGLGVVLNKTIADNCLLTIDEAETGLHPKLLAEALFEYLKAPDSRSQLIITTHYDGLLDLIDSLVRKDSILFAEKQDDGNTEIYRLSDFNGLDAIKSYRSAYITKRFGATMFS